MKTFFLRWTALVLLGTATTAFGALPFDQSPLTAKELAQGYREHRIIAKPKREFRDATDQVEAREGVRLRRQYPRIRDLRVLELDSADSAEKAIARLQATGRYEYVERDIILYARATPNDPDFSKQWSLRNTGAGGGIAGADIDAVTAWNTQSSAADVIVAIVDSGVRLTHEDLAANLWKNASGRHGINALVPSTSSSYTNPNDDSGHGTHVAGIVGAVGNNGTGISGVAWNVKLMPLKFINAAGSGSATDAIECIDYAVANGAHIINASYGSFAYSEGQYEAIKAARDAGIIFVAAAGNEATNNDVAVDYPSGYALDNIVSVASTTRADALAASSNTGPGSVDLAAPGDQIYSTYFESNSSYKILGGTSMAAPHVAGALALLKTRYPSDNYRQLINRLLRSAEKLPALAGKVQTGGRLNLAQALASTSNRPFNDDFADRALLTGPMVRVRSSNAGATAEPGEPLHAGVAGSTTLWWSWTATESTEVGFDTLGSSYDTALAVYTGSSLATLQPIAANDDASTTASRLLLNVTAGATYHIAVTGKNNAAGFTALKIGAVPAHDNFAAAKTLAGRSIQEASTTLIASRQTFEPNPTGKSAGHSVWYKWTAPAAGRYSLAAFSTTIDTLAAVYTGTALTNLVTVASNDNNANSTNTDALVSFDATAGVTYYFQIDDSTLSSSTGGGDFILTLTDSLWEFPTQDTVTSSPAVAADGTVYVGSTDGHVYAINPNGSRKWQFPASSAVSVGAFDGPSPAIGADGTVYIGSNEGVLYALNGANGAQKWNYNTGTATFSAAAVALDGTIYHRDETRLVALTPAGAVKWSFTLNTASAGGTYCSPVIAPDGTIYVGTTDGKFFALTDNGTGAVTKWSYTVPNDTANADIYTSPAIAADGTVYFGTLTGEFYALTPGANSATVKWSIKLPKFQSLDNSITSSPALAPDGTIYFAAYDHQLYALNPANGATKWTFQLGNEVRASSPAVGADGTVYIGAYDGLLYAVNTDGTLQRTFPSALLIRSSPALAGGRLYFGSNDAKLHAFDIGQSAAASPWPMYRANALNDGRAPVFLRIIGQPASVSANAGASATLTTTATGIAPTTYQWQLNGANLSGATAATLTLPALAPAHTGLYTAIVSGDTTLVSETAIVGLLSSAKTEGAATELQPDILHPNGKTFDQLLLTGAAAAFTADHTLDQVTRLSFIDLDDDIVQVELSGPGTVSLVLEGAGTPAAPLHYHQDVAYVKGHAGLVIAGADERTNISVFSVGRATAFDPTNTFDFLQPTSPDNDPARNQSPLFTGHGSTTYDGIADLAFIAILSSNGKFGGVRTANANYFSDRGLTGLYAPGVAFSGPVYIGDITALGDATPVLVTGSSSDTRITGGGLDQPNAKPVKVSGFSQLRFVDGTDSHGHLLAAQSNKARLEQDGVDVTNQLTVNPPPR